MNTSPETKRKPSRKLMILAIALCAALAIAAVIAGNLYSRYMATSMRILRLEGTVHLQQNGRSRTVQDSVRLQSGDEMKTEPASLVSVGLDETKIITLEEKSLADVEKRIKWLRLNLKEGCLFFQAPVSRNGFCLHKRFFYGCFVLRNMKNIGYHFFLR